MRPAQVTRSTQTVKTRPWGTQTRHQASTQTTHFHPLVFSPDATLISPKEYSPEIHYDLHMVVMLQKAVRGWLARRRLHSLRKEKALLSRASNNEVGTTLKSSHSTTSSSAGESPQPGIGQQHKQWRESIPMTELYHRLENWRKKQVSQINTTMSGKARRRALVALLDKETELLRSLEAHRALRSARRRNAAIARFLHEVSRAQVWEVSGEAGGEVEVETPETQPVRNLASLATALQQDASTQSRLQQLNALATTVGSHFKPYLVMICQREFYFTIDLEFSGDRENSKTSALYSGSGKPVVEPTVVEHFHPTRGNVARSVKTAQELISLARRGTHLLARGTTDARLRGLRKRLHTLVISFLHQVQGRESTVVAPRTIRAAGGKPVLAYGRHS
ncbi:hypothetical protein SK128_004657 [Halocaridina rubra]|uniref:IQ motif and ubiquitin-like domain-containing protein n=1 Tax=Halocaridina rubra TaxID=373956 RepID=A0AAN8ZVU0_HALRR